MLHPSFSTQQDLAQLRSIGSYALRISSSATAPRIEFALTFCTEFIGGKPKFQNVRIKFRWDGEAQESASVVAPIRKATVSTLIDEHMSDVATPPAFSFMPSPSSIHVAPSPSFVNAAPPPLSRSSSPSVFASAPLPASESSVALPPSAPAPRSSAEIECKPAILESQSRVLEPPQRPSLPPLERKVVRFAFSRFAYRRSDSAEQACGGAADAHSNRWDCSAKRRGFLVHVHRAP
jgi:hypothetical protein